MKTKTIILLILILLPLFYFRNIVFAYLSHSEEIDTKILSIMLQGSISPTKALSLGSYIIPLPKNAGYIDGVEYLIPKASWITYQNELKLQGWSSIEQNGTQLKVRNDKGQEFYISIKPYTGFYFIIKYSAADL